jgi:hypothetical protein
MLMWLLDRLPILVWAGSALLGWVAGELIATEPILQAYVASLADALGITPKVIARTTETLGAVLVVAVGWLILKASERNRARQAAKHGAE